MTWHSLKEGTLLLTLHIQPGAKKTGVAGLHGGALKIRLAAPPVEGQANARLIAWLADAFDVPQRNVVLKQGETSRKKVVAITGTSVNPESLLG